jgi:hypothetical protein
VSWLWYVAGAAFVALSVMDLLQTLALQKLGAIENNPLLGKHPRPAVLITFAVITTALWLGAVLWIASKGENTVAFVLLLGIGLRIKVIISGRKLYRELRAASTSNGAA